MIQIDMEKPNHCLHCPMCNGDDDCVLIQEVDTSWDWEEQYANCPLQKVEPERKKGHWIKKEPTIKELHGCYYECSKCHKFSLPFQKLNFCPNCGTDMREDT